MGLLSTIGSQKPCCVQIQPGSCQQEQSPVAKLKVSQQQVKTGARCPLTVHTFEVNLVQLVAHIEFCLHQK